MKIKKFFKNNWQLILVLLVFFSVICFSVCQTLVVNDDLPYSLYHRLNKRVTNIYQILRNQYSDYLFINGRFIVHCVVQFVLMFNKTLFSIFNPIFIIVSSIFTYLIYKYFVKNSNLKKEYIIIFILSLFLLLLKYKYLIYWVASSVNYVWVYTLLIIFVYYYLKTDLKKNIKLNSFIIFILSTLHECLFVFLIILLLFDLLYKIIINKEKIKDLKHIIAYIILCILGGLIVLLAPGNSIRMSEQSSWYNLSLLSRLFKSIPVVSINLFKLLDYRNIIPTIFLITLITYNYIKKRKIFNYLLIISSILSIYFNNGWLYLLLEIIIFINLINISTLDNMNKLSLLTISFYAASFSMILTPEYAGGRINYYFYMFLILCICIFINTIIKEINSSKFFNIFCIILFILTLYFEVHIYYNVGLTKKIREEEINNVIVNDKEIYECVLMDEKYAYYQADANAVCYDDYWASKYYKYYYNLKEKTIIVPKSN